MRRNILGLGLLAAMPLGLSSPRYHVPLPAPKRKQTPPKEHKNTREIERRKRQAARKAAKQGSK